MNKRIERNDPCWCGSHLKYKKCHMAFDQKLQQYENRGFFIPDRELIKTPEQIAKIKESCDINNAILDYVQEHICVGMTTEEIDQMVSSKTKELGGIPAPLGFEGFPKSVCTSINDQVCHGIPSDDVILQDGDIINVDISTIYNGYFSDASRMFCIGSVSAEAKKLVDVTKECVEIGIANVKPWTTLGDMADKINRHAKAHGYSIVREIGGHGIGLAFHEEPWVSYVSEPGTEMLMVPGMMFTIEPMINAGGPDIYVDEADDWTVYTDDGSLSAQWEVTVLVTETGCEVLAW